MLLHSFSADELQNVTLPTELNNPFHYTPHPLCRTAMHHVMQRIATDERLASWFSQGKMLGVLVVVPQAAAMTATTADPLPTGGQTSVAFLAAYSGNFEVGSAQYFVPPIFDLSQPHGFYVTRDREISALNKEIATLEAAPEYQELCKVREMRRAEAERAVTAYKQEMQAAKVRRDQLRASGTMPEGVAPADAASALTQLVRESQFQKAELKRLKIAHQARIQTVEYEIEQHRQRLEALKRRRREMSEALQRDIFDHFRFHNGRGEELSLVDIFDRYSPAPLPPAGAGECAGPRLLEYAYRHGLRPLAMAEFWYGRPTVERQRKHACCYPACQEKCAPILSFMLQGLAVEHLPAPTLPPAVGGPIEVLYEDDDLLVVDKPGGVLSVPGRGAHPYVQQLLQASHPEALGFLPVHRLDLDTSGLLLLAKNAATHRALQRLFAERQVVKEYQAWLQGCVASMVGVIRLPLSPDPYHRPKQRLDVAEGKNAVTHYRVLRREADRTLVRFMPLTGRTHQLRLHASAPEGLHAPIVGDPLYGHKKSCSGAHPVQDSQGLQLHACRLTFTHPRSGRVVHVERLKW